MPVDTVKLGRTYGLKSVPEGLKVTVADTPLEYGESEATRAVIAKKNATLTQPGEPPQEGKGFNGRKAVLAFDADSDKARLIPTDYATYGAYLGPETTFNRPFFPVGAAIAVITSDNMVLVGSRDQLRKKSEEKGEPCPYQFPCGFADVETGKKLPDGKDETIFDVVRKDPTRLPEILEQNALRELNEELIPLGNLGEEGAELKLLGFITSSQTWKDADGKEQKVDVVKTAVYGLQLEHTTAKQLAEARRKAIEKKQVTDVKEMRDISFVPVEQLHSIDKALKEGQGATQVRGVDGKDHPMVAEHSVVFNVLAKVRGVTQGPPPGQFTLRKRQADALNAAQCALPKGR